MDEAIDMVSVAILLGATFVARSFSGDKEQLVPLIKAAIHHRGAAFIDVISPCVAFNNHDGSSRSYDYVREHNEAVNRLDFMPRREAITTEYAQGSVQPITLHDGTTVHLAKVDAGFDPTDKATSLNLIQQHQARGEIATGLLYIAADAEDLHQHLNTVETPFNRLGEAELTPGRAALEKLNASLR
jgi:2-oxoglutarate ferredoxin oxidoreductase subunit beta